MRPGGDTKWTRRPAVVQHESRSGLGALEEDPGKCEPYIVGRLQMSTCNGAARQRMGCGTGADGVQHGVKRGLV